MKSNKINKKYLKVFWWLTISATSIVIAIIPLISTIYFNNNNKNQILQTKSTSTQVDLKPLSNNATYIDVNKLKQDMPDLINANEYVYNVDKNDIKKIIYKYVINPPPGFTLSVINFDITAPDHGFSIDGVNGEILVTIKLERYINDAGNIELGNFTPVQVVFGKYLPAPGKTVLAKPSININEPNVVPQTIYNNYDWFLKVIKDNNVVENLPITSNIELSNFRFSNSGGFISCDISVTGYFDDTNKFIPKKLMIAQNYKVYGFNQLKETIFPSPLILTGYENLLASDYITKASVVQNIIFNNIVDKVPTMTLDDINIVQISYDNVKGELIVDFFYRNFNKMQNVVGTANNDGKDIIRIYNQELYQGYIIQGFKNVLPTIIPKLIQVQDKNVLAQSKTEDEIKQLLLDNIANNNIGIDPSNIQLTSLIFNNLDGSISFTPKLDKYVDNNSLLYDVPGEFQEFDSVTIRGYKNISPTIEKPNAVYEGNSQLLPSDAIKDTDYIKQIIYNNLDGLPDNFGLSNIVIEQLQANNETGNVIVVFTLDNYYDETLGYWYNTPTWPKKYITITGFLQASSTVIRKQVFVPDVNEITASSYTDDELLNFVKLNINQIASPLPNSFNPDTNISLKQINRYDTTGEIKAFLEISCYYDRNGLVVNDDVIYATITFSGFKNINPTIIESNITLTGVSDISPADISETELLNFIFDETDINQPISPLIKNFPIGKFHQNNIILNITNRIVNDKEAYLIVDVSLNTYYNQQGILVENSNLFLTKYGVQIHGFKNVSPTEIKTNYRIPSSSQFANIYASDIRAMNYQTTSNLTVENLINDNRDGFFTSYPNNLIIKNIDIKNVHNDIGSLTINLEVLNYYNNYGKTENTISLNKQVTISGFKPVGSTTIKTNFHLVNVEDRLPSSFDSNELKEIVWNNRDEIFSNLPSNFTKDDITIELNDNSFINTKGQIIATISLKNYFDALGQQQTLIPMIAQITFDGFNFVLPTRIIDTITITKPGISKVLPTDFSDDSLIDFLYEERNNIFPNLPNNEFVRNDIILEFANISRNNVNGEIVLNPIKISTYYDNEGKLICNDKNNPLSGKLTIKGFASFNSATTIESEVDLSDTTYYNFLPSEISIDILRNIIITKNVVKIPAPGFSVLDIIIDDGDIINIDNLKGELTLNLKIKNFYQENGEISNSANNLLSQIVKFRGLKNSIPTTVNDIVISNLVNDIASTIDNNKLLQIIRDNYHLIFAQNTLPSIFAKSNILSVTKLNYDNKKGMVEVLITLNCYYDINGDVVANGITKDFTFTISGFKQLGTTILNKDNIRVNQSNKLASEISSYELLQIVYNNINNLFLFLPDNFSQNNLIINNFVANNIEGKITVSIALNYYLNDKGEFISSVNNPFVNNLEATITINGFKQVNQTIIKSNYVISGDMSRVLPSSLRDFDILRIITNNPGAFVENPYSTSSNAFRDDIIISNLQPNNLDGSITFLLSLKKYYDDQGHAITEGKLLSSEVTITGFLPQKATIFNQNVDLGNLYHNTIPQLIKIDQLYDIIYQNRALFFDNLPKDFTKSDINIVSINNPNNLEGSMDVVLKISNYYDQNGVLQLIEPYQYIVHLTGLKNILPSSINSEVTLTNFSTIRNDIPSNFFNNVPNLTKLIIANRRTIFNNMPLSFEDNNEFASLLHITPKSYNNALGTLVVHLEVDDYYDANGNYITNGVKLSRDVVLKGFNTAISTIIKDSFYVRNNNNYPSMVQNQDVIEIIRNQYLDFLEHLPPNFNPDVNITNINIVRTNDINGTIDVMLSLNYFYDENNEIVNNIRLMSKTITIEGFNSKEPTYFRTVDGGRINISNTLPICEINDPRLSNITPSSIDNYYSKLSYGPTIVAQQEQVNNFLYSEVIARLFNLDDDSENNVVVRYKEKSFNDKDGYLEAVVIIKKYISFDEGGENTNPANFVVRIGGFLKKSTAIDKSNEWVVILAIVLSVIAVIAIIMFVVFFLRFRVWRRGI